MHPCKIKKYESALQGQVTESDCSPFCLVAASHHIGDMS